ncbi:MAG: repair protein RecO [Actinomycetota bacterium]|jgi:DNA repair protein RecO (recombination protein O)
MPHYRDEGIILRTHKLGEVDRILTILTKDHGQIRAVAKGVRKTSSRFGARLEPFMVADLQLYEGKNLDTVSQVEQLASYGAQIVADYPKYTAANAMVEAAERLTRESSNSQQYLLLLGGLRALAGSDYEGSQVLDSYLLRALSLSGWVPELGVCQSCQSHQPQSFSVHTGHVSCANCALPGAVRLGSSGLDHMRNLLAGNWPEVAVAAVATKSNVSSVISAYLQWQLERGLRSMSMVERA